MTRQFSLQTGQTLIETMVAVFIMVMGITAALGLANYSLNASSGIRKQLIGIGLAREGIESIKNMRDTNWLNDSLDNNCYNFVTGRSGDAQDPAYCYQGWLNAYHGIQPQNPNRFDFLIGFDASATEFWSPINLNAGQKPDFRMYYDDTGGLSGFYNHDANNFPPSDFYRQITVDDSDTTPPFDQDTGARVLVTSRVWWVDKHCPASGEWPGPGRCSVQLQMYLTNWKTY